MSEESIRQLAEHKLIILHLLQKMGIALSNSEICQFLLEKIIWTIFPSSSSGSITVGVPPPIKTVDTVSSLQKAPLARISLTS